MSLPLLPPQGKRTFAESGRPEPPSVCTERIPVALRQLPQWVVWKYVEEVDRETGEVSWDKPPFSATTGNLASSTNPKTWTTFDVTLAAYQRGGWDGIGFVLHRKKGDEGLGLVGIDLDKCRDPETGDIEPWATEIIHKVGTYTEVSPSRRGLRLFCLGFLPPGRRKKERFEVYQDVRYVTVTGAHVVGTPLTIEERQEQLLEAHRSIFGAKRQVEEPASVLHSVLSMSDLELLEKARNAANGAKFRRLWNGDRSAYASPSEADAALANELAFWTAGDRARIDELFRSSGMFRSKWNRDDYRKRTIDLAMEGRTAFYDPDHYRGNGKANGQAHEHNGESKEEQTREANIPNTNSPAAMPTAATLMNFRLETVQDDGKEKVIRRGLSAAAIRQQLQEVAGDWPRAVNGRLFVEGNDYTPLWLDTSDELFAWIGRQLGERCESCIHWAGGVDMITQARFHTALRQTATSYQSIEPYPHWPPRPATYYMHPPLRGGDGRMLNQLVWQFTPSTDCDRELIRASILTLGWGGEPGSRPAFLFDSSEEDEKGGRGVGKSTAVQLISRLMGGHLDVHHNEDIDKLMTRLLSDSALLQRVALLDNIKTLRFSWADLEGLITTDTISGRALYIGESKRPNLLNWFITLNNASLSKDIAQRTVIIKLARPPSGPQWRTETAKLIDEHRWEIIGDIIAELRRTVAPLARFSRWGAWEAEVLAHVGEAAECQKLTEERQADADDDQAEADIVREGLIKELQRRKHDPVHEAIWIPSGEIADILALITKEQRPTNKATNHLKTLSIPELKHGKRGTHGRGWYWRGQQADRRASAVPIRNAAGEKSG